MLPSTSNSHCRPFGLILPSPGPMTVSSMSQPSSYNQATTTKAASSQPPMSIPQDCRAVSLLQLLAHQPHLPGFNCPCSWATMHHHNQRYHSHSSEHCHLCELRLSFGPQNHCVAHTQCRIQPRLVSMTVLIFASGRVPSLKTIHNYHCINMCTSFRNLVSMQSFLSSKSKISLAVVMPSSQSS